MLGKANGKSSWIDDRIGVQARKDNDSHAP